MGIFQERQNVKLVVRNDFISASHPKKSEKMNIGLDDSFHRCQLHLKEYRKIIPK